MRIQTLKKDFRVNVGELECALPEGDSYLLHGEIIASDFVTAGEAENWLRAKLGRKKLDITWDHSDNLIHKFTVAGIGRTSESQELTISWDGTSTGVNQKGSSVINIPPAGEFSVIDIIMSAGENQKIDIILSDPVEASQEIEGLIQFTPSTQTTVSINSNIISVFPSNRLQGTISLNVESSLKSNKGLTLTSSFLRQLNFTAVPPGIMTEGNGVILPSSKNLIFPFKAANLKAVDLRIVRIFDNNLPYFLQENNLNGNNSVKRFGRPVLFRKSRSGKQLRDEYRDMESLYNRSC